MSPEPDDQRISVDGHQFTLKRLDKVLYPEAGTTKAEVLDYYARIAPVLLPQLADRPVTRIRWPDGVDSKPFFEKNLPELRAVLAAHRHAAHPGLLPQPRDADLSGAGAAPPT